MKQTTTFVAFLFFVLLIPNLVWADAGIFAGAIQLKVNTTTQFYNASPLAGNGSAIGTVNFTSLGNFTQNSGNLAITGGEIKTYKNNNNGGGNVCNGTLFYQVRNSSNAVVGGTFGTMNLGFYDNCSSGSFPTGGSCGTGDQKWQSTGSNINLTTLPAGTYSLEIWFSATGSTTSNSNCTPDAMFLSNGGLNYNATFTICAVPTIGAASASPAVICYGSNTTISVASQTGADTYYWEKKNTDNSWSNVSTGSVSSSVPILSVTNLIETATYRCRITNCGGLNEAISNEVTVTPQRPAITLQPNSQTDCDGNIIDFIVNSPTATTFVWQRKKQIDPAFIDVTATTNSVITNGTGTSTLKVRNIGNTENPHLAQYQCIVTDANSCTNTSTIAILSVNSINNIADFGNVCENGSATFNVGFVGTTTAIKWQRGTIETTASSYSDLNDGTGVSGSTTNTLSLSNLPASPVNTYYRVRATFTTVSNSGASTCTQTQSATATITGKLTVIAAPIAPTVPAQARCGAGTLTLTASSTLGANEQYRWYENSTTSTRLQEGTSNSYTTTSLSVGTYTYFVTVYNTNSSCESSRTAVIATVNEIPSITLSSVSAVCPQETSFSLPYSATTGSPNEYNISSGSPAMIGFSPINNASLPVSPISVTIPANSTANTYQFSTSVRNSTTTCVSPSQNFNLTVKQPTAVTSHPSTQIVCEGQPLSLSASGTGDGTVSYQWRKNGTNISGETNATYAITNIALSQAGNYDCLVIAGCGTATTNIATITVNPKATFSQHPQNQTVCREESATFSVSASGTGTLLYRWKKGSTILTDGTNITGSTTNQLILTNLQLADGGTYICEVKGDCDADYVASNSATLIVNDLPLAPMVISPVNYCQNATPTSLSATASGVNSILWYGTNSVGGTSSGTAPTPLTNIAGTTIYYVSQKDGNSCESPRASISVIVLPAVSGTISGFDKICGTGVINNSTTLTANPSGGNGIYTYQWLNSSGNIASAANNTYDVTNGNQSSSSETYRVIITSGGCTATSSNSIVVSKQGWGDISITGNTPNICGSGSKTLEIVSPTSGATYKWFADATTNSELSSGVTFTTPTLSSPTTYYAAREGLIAIGLTCQSNRASATINISPIPSAPTISGTTTICSGQTTTLSASGCNGTVIWSNSTTGSTLTISSAGTYNATCTENGCVSLPSVTQTITVNSLPTITLGTIASVCYSATNFDLVYSSTTNSPNKFSLTSAMPNFTAITDADLTTSPISIPISANQNGTHTFTISVKNSTTGCISSSQNFSLTVLNILNGGTIATSPSATFCDGHNVANITSSTLASGGKTPLNYQWEVSTNGTDYSTVSGATTSTYDPSNISTTTYYRRKVTDACGEVKYSNVHQVNIVPDPASTIQISNNAICSGSTITLSSSVTGGTGTCTLSWQWATAITGSYTTESSQVVTNGNSYTFTPSALTNNTTSPITRFYRTNIDCVGTGTTACNSPNSSVVSVIINPIPASPTITSNDADNTICTGQSVNLTASGCGGIITWSTGATGSTLTISSAGTYNAFCTQNNCVGANSSTYTLLVNPVPNSPTIISSDSDNIICSGETVTLSANGCAGTITWNNGSTTSSINVTTSGTFSATCTENSCMSLASSVQTITVNPTPSAPIISGNTSLCSGEATSLTASGCSGVVSWSNGNSGSTITISSAGTYNAICTVNNCISSASVIQNISVNPKPAKPTISGLTAICSGTSTSLTASGCNGIITWNTSATGSTLNVSNAGTYTATCTENSCIGDLSDNFVLSLTSLPTITLGSVSNICYTATSFELPYTTTTNSPNVFSLTSNMPDFVAINDQSLGSSPIVVTIPATKNGTHTFTITAKNTTTGCISTLQNFNITVLNTLNSGTIETSPSNTYCSGYNPGSISNVSLASGGKLNYSYQWQSSTDGINFTDIALSTATTYDPPALTTTTYFRRKVTDDCGETKFSNIHQINVNPDPSGTITATTATSICQGAIVSFSATTLGGAGTCTIKWQSSNSSSSSGTWTDEQIGGTTFTTAALSTVGNKYFRIFYDCSVASCNQFTSTPILVTINPNPSVPIVNGGGTICSGNSTSLTASGCNGTVNWSNGQTTSIISVSSAGSYSATCSNACGTSASSNQVIVNITTISPPTISGSTTICSGQSANLSATGCNGVVNWSNGSTGSIISVSPTNTTNYTATCTENGCTSLSSNQVTVTINQAIAFSVGAVTDICFTANSFSLPYSFATGTADKYSLSSNLPDFVAINDANLSTSPITVSIPAGKTGTYSFTLTLKNTGSGCSLGQNFNITVLNTLNAGSIEASPSAINCSGYNPGSISNVSLASGGKLNYSYQWQSSTDGINFTDIALSTATTYDPPALTTTTYFRRKVTDDCGETKFSNIHQINVNPDPSGTITATSATTICQGATVSFSATTLGGAGTCTIKWQSSNSSSPSGTWTDEQIGGTTFTSSALSTVGNRFFRIFYDCSVASCNQFTSTPIQVTINPNPNVPIVNGGGTICSGSSTSLTASGCNGTVNWSNGQTTSIISVSSAGSYSATCSNACGTSASSNQVVVNITTISPPILSGSTTICNGQSASLSATGCNGVVNWSNGSTGSIISVSPTNTTNYTATCTESGCTSLSSNQVTVTINQSIGFSVGAVTDICFTANSFSLPYSFTAGTADKYSLSSNLPDFVAINDANLSTSPITVSIPAGKTGTYSFTLTLKNTGSGCSLGQNFNITVLNTLNAGSIEASPSAINCSGYNPGSISNVSLASGGKLNYSYQWQSSTDGINFTDIALSTATTYDPPALTTTTYFRRKVTDDCGEMKFSNIHQINIVPDPQISITDATDKNICSGGSISLSATISGGSGTCTPTWQSSSSLSGTWTDEQIGGLSFTKSLTNTNSTPLISYYRVIYACSGTGSSSCNQSISANVKVTVNYIPNAPVVSPSSITICTAQSALLTASGCSGSILWSNSQTSSTISVSSAGTYSVKCIVNNCESSSSNISTVTVSSNGSVNPPIIGNSATICQGQTVNLTATNCIGTITWNNGNTGTSILVNPAMTTNYSATCFDGNCTSNPSNIATITVNPLPNILNQPQNQSDCRGNGVSFSVSANVSSGTISYQWQRKKPTETVFSDFSGATTNSVSITNVGNGDNLHQTEYRCILTGTGGCTITSNIATLTVNSVSGTLANQNTCEGNNISLNLNSLTIVGNPSFQWQKKNGNTFENVVDGGNISGSQTQNLQISNVLSANSGEYRNRMVFNLIPSGTCTINSDAMTLGITAIPVAPTVNTPISYCQNAVAQALIATPSSGNSLVWYSSATGGVGSTSAIIPNTSTVGTFSYFVSQKTNTNCESARAEIQVIIRAGVASPINTTPPTVTPPAILTFSATTTISGASLLWYNSSSTGTGSSQAPSYTAPGTYTHWVSQTDPISGCESPRLQITSTILNIFRIIQHPGTQADCRGNSVYMDVTATGPNTSFTYQWQRKRPNETDFSNLSDNSVGINGWFAKTMRISNVGSSENPHLSQYRCIISDGNQSLISNIATLHVNSLTGSLQNFDACVGGNTSVSLNNFIITGNVLSYQWQTRPGTSGAWTNLSDGNGISGSNTIRLNFTNVQFSQGQYYRCVVKFNTMGVICDENSDPALLSVGGFPGSASVSDIFYCQFSDAVKLKINNPIKDFDEVWYTQPTGGIGTTTAPTPLTSSPGTFSYYVSFRTEQGCESPRAELKVNIGELPPAPKNTTVGTVDEGNALTFSAEGQNLRWYTTPTIRTFSTVAPSFTAPATYVRYVSQLSASSCESPRTTIVSTILPVLKLTKQPISQADCEGNSVTFSLTSAGKGIISYQWQRKRPNESNFVDLPNEKSASLKIEDIGSAESPYQTKYRCVIKDEVRTLISEEVNLTVNAIKGNFKPISICDGKPASLNLKDLVITGKIVSYQWQRKSGSSYTDIPNENSATTEVNQAGTYRCRIIFEVDSRTTCPRNTPDLVVENRPTPIAPQVSDASICQNISNFLVESQVKATNPLLWYDSKDAQIGKTTAPKIDLTKIGKTTFYVSQITNFGCESERKSFELTVSPIPNLPVTTAQISLCRNAPTEALKATAEANHQIIWYSSVSATTALTTTPIPNTQTDGQTSYFVSARNQAGCESPRVETKITVSACIVSFENNFNNCLTASTENVTGNRWFDLFDATGRLYASVNPNGLNLGKVTIQIKHYGRGASAIPKTPNETRLMARYIDFQSSVLKIFDKPVSLKIYYQNSEFNEYKQATNLPNLTINDFNILHYDGVREDCGFENNDNFKDGESYVIYKNVLGSQVTPEFFSLQFDVNSFSENAATANDFNEITYNFEKVEEKSVKSNWVSSLEVKAEKYWIQRSPDGKTWTTIKDVKANGNPSNYESFDYQPLGGKSYYRIVYIDKDGTKKYFDAKEVIFNDPICQVYPNPTDDKANLNLYYRNINATKIELVDMLGHQLGFNSTKTELGIYQLKPTIPLAEGAYFVVITDENGKRCIQKVVVKN